MGQTHTELILLFLYMGVIGLHRAFENPRQGARAGAFLALIGLINVPLVHFSVHWWNTLHQGSTISLFGHSKIAASMVWPLFIMMAATLCYFLASLLSRMRADLLMLESDTAWVRRIALEKNPR
jgi:heme exporter protein C